jgi:hypothetical protein
VYEAKMGKNGKTNVLTASMEKEKKKKYVKTDPRFVRRFWECSMAEPSFQQMQMFQRT